MKTMLMLMLAAGAAVSLRAQDQDRLKVLIDRLAADRVANGGAIQLGTFQFLTGDLVSGKLVKGAPFSAEAVTETTQTLGDGNRIVQRSSSKQYRDSEGRERREETTSMGAIFISDPVARVNYTLHPETRTAEKTPLFPGAKITKVYAAGGYGPVGPTFFFNGRGIDPRTPAPLIDLNGGGVLIPSGNSGQVEQLGTVQVEGVPAQGTRTTTTIPAGQIGNDRPINVVSERWYSPDLQLTVMTKHSDPRSGETVYKLTSIVRVDQLRSLFELPSDYTVTPNGLFNLNNGAIRLRIPQR
jgi:hypothetical protein